MKLGAGLDGVVIDVRTPAEFKSGHIPGAILAPLADLQLEALGRKLPAGAHRVYVICQSGARARRAMALFEKAGIDRCVLVEGGMDAWAAARLPMDQTGGAGISILRQVQIIIGTATAMGAALALAVDPVFALIPVVSGVGLMFAGISGWCGLALLLAKMPWNRLGACEANACCAPTERRAV